MPFGGLGMWEVLLILLVLLLVFGAKRLPELGGALGKGIREFKGSVRDIEKELSSPVDTAPKRELNKSSTPTNSTEGATPDEPAKPQEPVKPQTD